MSLRSRSRERSKKKGSVFTLLLRSYILFTFLIVIILCMAFLLFLLRTGRDLPAIDAVQLSDYDEALIRGDYRSFPTAELLGDDGYILIVDQEGKNVYQSGGAALHMAVEPEELACIPVYRESLRITVKELAGRGGAKDVAVSMRWYEGEHTYYQEYVFDEKYRVLYGGEALGKERLTAKEFALLSDTGNKEYSIRRYPFFAENGQPYTLLLYQSKSWEQLMAMRMGRAVRASSWFFVLVYCLLIGLFILSLNRKIKKPLRMLCEALNSFSQGEENAVFYQGPREFVDICDSFNRMSRRLVKSETLRKKLEADKQKMLADISHDLKTPITVVQGYAKALNDGVVPEEEQQQYLATIEQKTAALNELIDTFYGYSRMEHPDYSLTLETTDICNYLRDYIADRYNELDLAGFQVEVDIPETHIPCGIDRVQLKRVFENIFVNSMRHNEKPVTLFCSLRQEDDWVYVILGDDGVGIPQEVRPSIFEPFVVGEKSRSKYGSGLGLSIALKIAEAHGGTLRLMDPEEGPCRTAFEMRLPIKREALS